MTAIRANTSRHRFDEARRFTGVYQRMGQIGMDADWNEEVLVRTTDARRRTGDLANGSPDDGYRIGGDFLVDPVTSVAGWSGTPLPASDFRSKARAELRLDRHDSESLPWVVRSRWHTAVRRTLPAPLDLRRINGGGVTFGAGHVVFAIKLERLPTDDEVVAPAVFLDDGAEHPVAIGGLVATTGWSRIAIPVAAFAGLDPSRVVAWGVRGLPPMSPVWLGGLRVTDPALGTDVVIAGGDGTLAGGGRMLIDGVRSVNEGDLRYTRQPDLPDEPPLPGLGATGLQHGFYLDVWEQTVAAVDDPFLLEPALDGVETGARLRLVTQVRAWPAVPAGPLPAVPSSTGLGRFTTNIPDGVMPDRDRPEPPDPCRDRCLATANVTTGRGYTGSDNLHVRVEILRTTRDGTTAAQDDVVLWSRDNGSTAVALVSDAPATATSVKVAPADAARLGVGDVVVVEDRVNRLRWDAPRPAVVRRIRGVQTETGVIEFEDAGQHRTDGTRRLDLGGRLGRSFAVAERAQLRRWDGADLAVTGVRYALTDGITFALGGGGFRNGDYWTFTARVHAPDGGAHGVVDQLSDALPHGPIHRYVVLGRATQTASTSATYVFEDLRPRFLPLAQVRDRLRELGDRQVGPAVFTVVVGDGVRSFGDVDQVVAEGITGDEALQIAIERLRGAGGSVFVRAGTYQLEHPVLIHELSSVRLIGDGAATRLECRGAGGALYLDRCGRDGAVVLEALTLIEDPAAEIDVGDAGGPDRPPVRRPLSPPRLGRLESLLADRVAPRIRLDERVLRVEDVQPVAPPADFGALVAAKLRTGLAAGAGRAAGSVVATLAELRRRQREHEGILLEDDPAVAGLLAALDRLPHGVVTLADCRQVALRGCTIESRRATSTSVGVLVTGTCSDVLIDGCTVTAATGIGAIPYAPYFAPTFLLAFPRAGLRLDELAIRGCHVVGGAAAATGIHVADGALRGVAIDGNHVEGFPIGILLEDVSESAEDVADDRTSITGNRIAAAVVGIQLAADGVDVVDNEVTLTDVGDDEPVVSAAVVAAGHALRIAGTWITLPSAGPRSPLAIHAGVVIGDGLDTGSPARPVADVEVVDNRIEGPGDASLAVGVIVGGPQPIYDVRVHGNVIRNLGDAAIRSFSTSGPIGRLAIERNRIERVALADPPPQFANTTLLRRLQPDGPQVSDADASRPRTLLAALVATSAASVRPQLDAALRWIERLTLRGAIVLGGVDGAVVTGNHLVEIGRTAPYAAATVDGAAIELAAIAAVASVDIAIADNHVVVVHAPFTRLPGGGDADGDGRPAALELLDAVGLVADQRLDRADVHLAVTDLRARVLQYAGAAADDRARLARTLFGPLDAVLGELAGLGGRANAVTDGLRRDIGELRTAATAADQLTAATALRATLSQAASATVIGARPQDAWDAAAQLDLALLRDGAAIAQTATRLSQRSADLTAGLPPQYLDALTRSLTLLIQNPGSTDQQLAAAGVLGRVASVRDLMARREELPTTGELVGPRKTVVAAFAERASTVLAGIAGGGDANRARLTELRATKDALLRDLGDVHAPLALDVESDFRDVDRTGGEAPIAIARMRSTLARVHALAGGPPAAEDGIDEEGARADAQGRAAGLHLYAKTLDRQISGLLDESADSVDKSLRSFTGVMDQLVQLGADDPSVADLVAEAGKRVTEARSDASTRAVNLAAARGLLELVRGRLAPVLPVLPGVEIVVVRQDRRLAALAMVVLDAASLPVAARAETLGAFARHLDRVHAAVRADGGVRQTAAAALAAAPAGLDAGGDARDRVVADLAGLVAGAAALARSAGEDDTATAAVAVLAEAIRLGLDPTVDRASRLAEVKRYLGDRGALIAPSLAAQVDAQADLAGALALLRAVVGRAARGELSGGAGTAAPQFDLDPQPADGVFVAGVQGRARIATNHITSATTGVRVTGAIGHAVTEPPDDGAAVEVIGNRVDGCALAGMEVRTDGRSTVTVWDNQITACAGAAVAGADAWGQAVLAISGAGEVIVRGNLLAENGNRALRTLLHEVVIDWRGDVAARGNTIRHLGGGAGGAALLVMVDPVAAALIADLSRTAFLGVEPPPAAAPPRAAAGDVRAAGFASVRSPLALGNLHQLEATAPALHRALTFTGPVRSAPPQATTVAASYLARPLRAVALPLINFLLRPPIRVFPLPPLRAHHTAHVEGNDVTANGPALLMLSEGQTLWAVAVSGNQLASVGAAGAVYLRRVDSTVFAGNRCENVGVVNAVLVRAGKAPVTATGNVILSAEPIAPRPRFDVIKDDSAVTLSVGVGTGALHIPVDGRKLLGGLERRRTLASDTFAELLSDLSQPTPTPTPAPTPAAPAAPAAPGGGIAAPGTGLPLLRRAVPLRLRVTGTATDTEIDLEAIRRVRATTEDPRIAVMAARLEATAAQPTVAGQPPPTVEADAEVAAAIHRESEALALIRATPAAGLSRQPLTSGLLSSEARAGIAAALPTGTPASIGARTVYTSPGADEAPAATLKKLVDRVALHADDAAAAKTAVTAALTAAGGDPARALKLVDEHVLGIDTTKPTIRESITNTSLIAEALADHLAASLTPAPRPTVIADPVRPVTPPPPAPAAHSLVIIGGTHVATVGNATTAGVLVVGADRVVELNA